MKKLLTLVLCWLLAFSAIAETTFKAKTAASVAGGYVTSLNKVDGSFEDGSTQWSASVGTIVPTASTEFQGNNIGVWSGTVAGTLDLQWTATASNTYEASAQVDVQGEDDVYVCAYVGTTETGCKLIPALSKIQKVSVVADSVMSSAFYLRLKHTGSDAFSVKVDDGKIEPWTPQAVNLVEQESVSFTGYSSGTNPIVFKTKDTTRSNEKNLIAVSTVGSAGTASRYTVLKPLSYVASTSIDYSTSGTNYTIIIHYDSAGNQKRGSANYGTLSDGSVTITGRADIGDYFIVQTNATVVDNTATHFSITATAISENVVQSYAPSDRIGETIYLPQNVAPRGFISAMGSILGKTSGTHQGDAYYPLYAVCWANALNTAGQPYYISAAKGADALTDWNAGKTIAIDESGLFTRAFKSGTSGNIGQKQDDAFQGHWHTEKYTKGGTFQQAGTDSQLNPATYPALESTTNLMVRDAISDGTNGTPRTSNETRPVNVAKYVFIRYGNDAPTLLALPNGTETNYSITATGNAAQVITANVTDIPFIATTQNNLVWSGSSFTSPTDSIYQVSASINFSTNTGNAFEYYINGSRVGRLYSQATGVSSIFPFSTTIAVPANSTFSIRSTVNATLSNTADHRLQITRVNGKIDKTFVGNVAKNQVAIVQYRGNGSRTTLGTTPVAMPLTHVKGDTSIVSIASNQLTLQAGEYEISAEANALMYSASTLVYGYLYNVTTSSEVERALPARSDNAITVATPLRTSARISIQSATVFDFRAVLSTGSAYLGDSNPSPNDLNGFIKITKLNGQ